MEPIPYGRQEILQEDIDAVVNVLRSDYLTQGPVVEAFEGALKSKFAARSAIVVNSATSALHLACLSLGLGPGDIAWTTPISFVATANCVLYCGATLDFVDIDLKSYNMSYQALEEKLKKSKILGKVPKVVIVVHMCGNPADMKEVSRLSREYGFRVIEDASHAIGASYDGRFIGSCQYSDLTIFSFHPVKIITTGEGGAVLTNDSLLAEKVRLLRSHGVTRDSSSMRRDPEGGWYYEQIELGFNYRMTDIQAALGLSQIERLPLYIKTRNDIAIKYNSFFKGSELDLPLVNSNSISAWHLYIVRIKSDCRLTSRKDVFEFLRKKNIGVNVHYIPIYKHPYYSNLGFSETYCENAELYYRSCLTLPIFPTLTDIQIEKVATLVKAAIQE